MNKKIAFAATLLVFMTFIATTFIYEMIGFLPPIRLSDSPSINYNKKLSQVTDVIQSNFLYNLDSDKLIDSAAHGVAATADDPYTVYYSAEEYKRFNETFEGSYSGVGLVVSATHETNEIIVISPFDDTPAQKAGIVKGDIIVKVEGKDVAGDKLDEAVRLMKGKTGTPVTITIFRKGWDAPKDFQMNREQINIPNITQKMLANQIGYIRILKFDLRAADQFREAIAALTKDNMKGLIIDVRDNPGGAVNEVREIADILLPEGLVMYAQDKNGKRMEEKSDKSEINLPMAILVNEGSASASEILSGALKDYGKAVVVGKKTFGKGVVQRIFPLTDGSAVQVTIQQYFTPKGNQVHKKGILPDVEVALPADLESSISKLTLEQDTQLSKALEVVKGKLQ
ncbi:MAG: S41 family peptidase [Hyphomonadaceae bacterium]|nr:S41 family peptidase [Clostridia bacterium]